MAATENIETPASLEKAAAWLAACGTLPADVEARARLLLLDTFGCLLAGLRHGEVRQFGRALRLAFPGETAWPGSDVALGPAGLGALGAAAACWDEACEGHSLAHGRPGLPVVPALLALTATQNTSLGDVSLGDLLLALATGYEIGTRAGQAWRIPPGWHVDGSWHSLGVAAAVARLTCGPRGIQPAIEAAACQIPASLYLPIAVGSVLRNTYPAHAVLLGMMSAGAAHADFDMPRGALEEARRRVLRADAAAAPAPPGEWTILEGYLKPYAGVRHTHYGVAACVRLRQHPAFALEKVGAIRLQTYPEAVQYCGNRAPRTAIQAQFSLSYAIAAALLHGDLGPEAYANVGDPILARVEQSVVIMADPARLRRGATVTIDVGGTAFTDTVDGVTGDPQMPMSRDEAVAKFRRYAEPTLGKRAELFVDFFLDGSPAVPARKCFTLAT
jgi:2-methylcitrate dehydratase PrpD